MIWPFKRREGRSADPYAATDIAVRDFVAGRAGGQGRPEALAIVEACIGVWERAFAAAKVLPPGPASAAVGPALMALAGRALARSGNAVFLIRVDAGTVRLDPAAAFDIRGGADPASWRYRVSLAAPSIELTETVAAAAVVHLRIGADIAAPWRGRSPLERARTSSQLLADIERSLDAEARIPPARIAPYPGAPGNTSSYGEQLRAGGLVVTGAASMTSHMGGAEPAQRWAPQIVGPAPALALTALRTEEGRDIVAAFGLSPALFAATGDGAGQREAWRRAWTSTFAPVAAGIAAELAAKLDSPDLRLDLAPLRASDEDGRSRAVARRATAFRTFVDAGVDRAEARRLAGLDTAPADA